MNEISSFFSIIYEIVCEKPNENFPCTSHAFHIISSSSDSTHNIIFKKKFTDSNVRNTWCNVRNTTFREPKQLGLREI